MSVEGLNIEQRRAAETTEGPLMIIAGPGTGKTKTLTARIAHLIASRRAKPSEILALTFTNKAAAEMQSRVAELVGDDMPVVTTFHGLCYQLLSKDGEQGLTFITEPERAMVIRQLRTAAQFKSLSAREIGLQLSRLKNDTSQESVDSSVRTLLVQYNQVLEERGLYDFDDLLLKTRSILLERKPILPYVYTLVDEFQDTNALQYELLQLLRSNDNLCVIGDPLQSIYGFRGADSAMFDRFATDFPVANRINLITNYRSTPEVVHLTNAIFSESPQLKAHSTTPGEVKTVEVLNEYSEASWIVDRIEAAIGGSSFLRSQAIDYASHDSVSQTFRDFAILYRTHRVGRTVQRALNESGMPFQVVGEGSFYEQPAIWAVIEIMRYLHAPTEEHEIALGSLIALKNFTPLQRRALLEKLDLTEKVSELAGNIMELFGLDNTGRHQLIGDLIRFDDSGLAMYLRYVDELLATNFYDSTADSVTLTTIHAAKGLEFSHVFLIGAEEGILPHERPGGQRDDEEEQRLLYVAVSRARTKLDILHAKTRAHKRALRSHFLDDISSLILPTTQDRTMATQERRLQKRKTQRSQATLFDL